MEHLVGRNSLPVHLRSLNKAYAKELESKLKAFHQEQTQTKKSLFLTMVTTYGEIIPDWYKKKSIWMYYLKIKTDILRINF